jgi:superfamily I DNA/RNA helicase
MLDWGTLNPEQREAVKAVDGPVLILAGAGTGKTRVITCRIAHLMERGVSAERILGVTFTNKAAREMQERVRRLVSRKAGGLGGELAKPTLCTFHSLCVRVLRRHIERLGYRRNFVIYDESEQLGVMRKLLSRISGDGAKQDPAAVLAMLSRYRNGGSGSAAYVKEGVAAMAEHVRERYESALRACNAVDFDGLILLVLKLFEEVPEALEECRDRYQRVMVDEYQDTNAAQFQLVHALTRGHRNLCVVGDDDQSIYGWRGAEIANLLEMERFYPEVKVIRLERNYRSTGTILAAANALIQGNARRRPKELRSQKGAGTRIVLRAFEHEEEEAQVLVEEIQAGQVLRGVEWSKVAILFRTNVQSRPIETALRQARVPYRLVGGMSFFDRREVRDLVAYLKVLVNPQDDISLLRIANVPARGLSDAIMERVLARSQEQQCPVFTAMRLVVGHDGLAARARESVAAFVGLIDGARATLESGAVRNPGAWAVELFEGIGYFGELRRLEKDPEVAGQRVQNLKDMLGTLDGVEAGRTALARLEAFLEEITLDSDRNDRAEEAGAAVTLITMHSCKGLEFPHVYVVGLEEGLLPHTRSIQENSLEEERRLLYVAITRAMDRLTLSHCGARKKYGQLVPAHPSRFLVEIPPDLVEDGDARARAPVAVKDGKRLFAGMLDALDAS